MAQDRDPSTPAPTTAPRALTARQTAPTGPGPAPGWFVLVGAVLLMSSQGAFGDSATGDIAAQHAAALAFVGGFAGLTLALSPQVKVAAIPAFIAGVLSVLLAVLSDVPIAAEVFSATAGGAMIVGAALALGGAGRSRSA
ncbi:hypothetical protein ABFT23_01220 [Nocardioides sp. C4-1]|uniref:hypothetical protein n=1 Tax=Nocardioides sp. C4-1 TaxID=3151851 RepID=UPI003263187F